MGSNKSDRREFLKKGTIGLAGGTASLVAGVALTANGQPAGAPSGAAAASAPVPSHVHNEAPQVGTKFILDHMTHFTPLQDYAGIITPARLHFLQEHASEFPAIDASQHRLTIHGLVDRPLSFSMDDLKRLPSVSRIHFLECQSNSDPGFHAPQNPIQGLPVQYIHGMTSCNEWSGVPFSVLLNEVGLQKDATWLVLEGADAGKFTHTLPVGKALEDSFVAYSQNGEPLRREQGFPIRAIVPGWEGPFSVKYLSHIKVTDRPYHTWNESMNHSVPDRHDLGGKSRWYHFQYAAKSVITRPSAGIQIHPGYAEITGLAWSGAGKVSRVEVSIDGGKSWKDAKLEGPVLSKAHTRFTFDWWWEGQETTIMSRCTDETGDVQPSVAELSAHWNIPLEDWKDRRTRPTIKHMNAIQPWKIARDGSISDAMFA